MILGGNLRVWFQGDVSGGSRRRFQGKVSGGGFRRRFLGSIQWEVSRGDFKLRFQEISGDSFRGRFQ